VTHGQNNVRQTWTGQGETWTWQGETLTGQGEIWAGQGEINRMWNGCRTTGDLGRTRWNMHRGWMLPRDAQIVFDWTCLPGNKV